ncbi:MAG: SRPBCC domain-containing protein [Emcibacteraceae bacterium]|nr:SRPBCC domain-containing protein [Emcibacteraceae bacterium]
MTDMRKIENPFVVKVVREFNFPIERVFDAWLDGDNIGKWFFATPDGDLRELSIDPKVGGGFVVAEQRGDELARHVGTYHEIVRPNRLVFSYYYDTGEAELSSNVTVELTTTDDGCSLALTHEMDDIYSEYEQSAIEGWNMVLSGLEAVL